MRDLVFAQRDVALLLADQIVEVAPPAQMPGSVASLRRPGRQQAIAYVDPAADTVRCAKLYGCGCIRTTWND